MKKILIHFSCIVSVSEEDWAAAGEHPFGDEVYYGEDDTIKCAAQLGLQLGDWTELS